VLDVDALLDKIAVAMQARAAAAGGPAQLGERRDLEPEFEKALEELFPGLAEKDRKVAVPTWPRAGRVDAIVRAAEARHGLKLAVELKWAASGQIYEGIWDLFKMALVACRDDVEWACLATGAPLTAWATDPCRDLFEDQTHGAGELCSRRFAANGRLMWDDALAGGYDSFPAFVPASIQTRRIGAVAIGSGADAWELRLVRVHVDSPGLIAFSGGWPRGERPADAKHPVRK
jgi:hypothetical protein